MHATIIKRKNTFKYIFNKGESLRGNYLSIYYVKKDKKNRQFGVCVSKKNGNSVSRNKLKRWVREVYSISEEKLKRGTIIIVSIKKGLTMEDLDYYKVKEDLDYLFNKADLYDKSI